MLFQSRAANFGSTMAETNSQSAPEPFALEPIDAPGPRLVAGVVEHVLFRNPDNGYHVLRVKTDDRSDAATVVGHSSSVGPGERIRAEGEWTTHKSYGRPIQRQGPDRHPPLFAR